MENKKTVKKGAGGDYDAVVSYYPGHSINLVAKANHERPEDVLIGLTIPWLDPMIGQ